MQLPASSPTKKRKRQKKESSSNPLFSAISQLESEDAKASKIRRTLSQKAAAKSQAARSQADLQGELVECRILLQKALSSQYWKLQFNNQHVNGKEREDDNDDDFSEDDHESRCNPACETILSHFLQARRRLCLSDLDDNNSSDEDSQHHDDDDLSKNKYKLLMDTTSGSESEGDEFESKLQKEYEFCKTHWKEVLNRRHNNLRLHSGLAAKSGSKFRVVDQSFWDQFESNISHERLMHLQKQNTMEIESHHLPSFDDSKLYQHILKDFISLGAATQNGGSAAADAAADRLRKAMKKKNGANTNNVDTKASKGRKIRYVVHEKLANFAFPVSRPVPAINEDDWFRSLFGGAATRKHV